MSLQPPSAQMSSASRATRGGGAAASSRAAATTPTPAISALRGVIGGPTRSKRSCSAGSSLRNSASQRSQPAPSVKRQPVIGLSVLSQRTPGRARQPEPRPGRPRRRRAVVAAVVASAAAAAAWSRCAARSAPRWPRRAAGASRSPRAPGDRRSESARPTPPAAAAAGPGADSASIAADGDTSRERRASATPAAAAARRTSRGSALAAWMASTALQLYFRNSPTACLPFAPPEALGPLRCFTNVGWLVCCCQRACERPPWRAPGRGREDGGQHFDERSPVVCSRHNTAQTWTSTSAASPVR